MLNDICTKPYGASFVDKYLKKENISRVPNSYLYMSEKKKKMSFVFKVQICRAEAYIYVYIIYI